MSQQSAFKEIYSEMLRQGGDFSKLNVNTKKQIKCYVKESFPHFLVTDNYFYVACYFTKKAVDEFKAKYGNVNITDLKSRVILITDWALEMNRVNSSDVFTSYGGLEIRLIVRSFKPNVGGDKDKVILSRHPVNLFRDDEMKTLVNAYAHGQLAGNVKGAKANAPEISSLGKGNVSQGVVSCANSWGFKDGKTATVELSSIFKQEKGADALKRLSSASAGAGRAKVVGGAAGKRAAKSPKKRSESVKNVVSKLMKSTPGGRASAAKKSTQRLAGHKGMPSPGSDAAPGTTGQQTMQDFQKMVNYIKAKKGKGGAGRRTPSAKPGKKSRK